MPSLRITPPAHQSNATHNISVPSLRATPLARALAAIGVGVGVGALAVAPSYALVVTGCAKADTYTILGNTSANNTRVLSANVYDNDSSASTCPVPGPIGTAGYSLRPVALPVPSKGVLTWTGTAFSFGLNSGAFTYKPNIGASGADSFSYCLYDANAEGFAGDCTNVVVNITAPTNCSAQTDYFSVAANASITASANANVLSNDSANSNVVTSLRVASFTAANHGAANVSSTGVFTYTPTAGFSGDDRLTYAVDATCAGSTNAYVYIQVLPVAVDDNFSTPINTPLTTENLLLNDFVLARRVSCPAASVEGGVVSNCSTSGAFNYTPPTGFSGADSFQYTVYDNGEGTSATANVFINVIANQPPIANGDGPYTLAYGASYTGPASGATNILANDTDPDSDTLTVIGNTAPGRGSVGNVATTGAFTYTPTTGISGTDSFTYTISDGKNNNATATVSFLILPAAATDTYTTPFNTALVVPLVSGVLSNDGGSGLTVLSNTNAAHGTVNVAANGTFTYTPLSTYSGADSFTYTLKDQANSNATATVNLTVGAKPNTVPVANADGPIAVAFGGTGAGNVLTNDSDADGDTLSVTGNSAPARGSVGNVSANGAFTYTPNVGISGADSFSYTISDGKGGTASNTVSFIVAPKAVVDSYTTPFNTALVVPLVSGVLSNDGGSGLTILSNTNAAHGTVNVAANGTFTYTPNSTYSGADSFTYTLKDQANSNATATVNLSVGVAPILFGFVDSSGSVTDSPTLGRGAVQRTIVSTSFAQPLIVKVLRSGAPVVGQLMCFTVAPSANGASAALSAATATTDSNGVASVTARANGIVGSYTVVVTVCPVAAIADSDKLKASASDSLIISLANDPLALEPSVPVPSVLGWLSGLLSGLLALLGVAFTGRRRR